MIKKAREYNKSLIGISSFLDPFSQEDGNQTEDDIYNNLLKIDDTGMMGYIDIPKNYYYFLFIMVHQKKSYSQELGHLKILPYRLAGKPSLQFYQDIVGWLMQNVYGFKPYGNRRCFLL